MNYPDESNVMLTHHARQKMQARGVTFQEVLEVLRRPDITEPHKGKRRYVKGPLAVVVDARPDDFVVVTILLRSLDAWTDEDVLARGKSPR